MEHHGDCFTRLYSIWQNMKLRCLNGKDKLYKHYGGRGIKICQEWLVSYTNFRCWAMENGYQDDLTIDRIDVNGNYEPDNCRWVTQQVQCANRRNTIFITIDGMTKSISEWSKFYNVPRGKLYRYYKASKSFVINGKVKRWQKSD